MQVSAWLPKGRLVRSFVLYSWLPATEGSKHKSSVGAIAGGVVGGVVVLILIALAIFVVRRRRRNRQGAADRVTPTPYGANHPGIDQGYSYNDGNGEKNAPNGTEYGVPVTYTGGQQAPSPTEGGSMRPYKYVLRQFV